MLQIHDLPVGAQARIVEYASHNTFTERLREMGLIPGTTFTFIRQAPLGGPMEIQFGQSRLALRPTAGAEIFVEHLV